MKTFKIYCCQLFSNVISLLFLIVILITLFEGCKEEPRPFPPVQPCPGVQVVSYDGEEYPTVQIGEQCWLTKNMNIGITLTDCTEMSNNGVIEKYCYNNDTANCNIYGGLYQWDELMQYSSGEKSQGICPDGWHIPSNREFVDLFIYCDNFDTYLKGAKDSLWGYITYGATFNTLGFSALPGGIIKEGDKSFQYIHEMAEFWSSKNINDWEAVGFKIPYNGLDGQYISKTRGISVRCIKDE